MTNDSTYGAGGQPGDRQNFPSAGGFPATPDVLATGNGAADDASSTRRFGWAAAAGAGVLVLALVGGVAYGLSALSGSGKQPEEALPAGAFLYADLDLDPSAGQKVDAFRFLRKFPELKKDLQGDDLRKNAFEAMAPEAGWEDIDYEKDVEPWLGDRLALGLYPSRQFGATGPAGSPAVVVALQVLDEDAARAGMEQLRKASDDDSGDAGGYVVAGDYVLIAQTQKIAVKAAEAAADGTMTEDPTFREDMSVMEDGVASMWVDTEALVQAAPEAAGLAGLGPAGVATTSGASGRAAFVARFDGPDVLEVVGSVFDAEAVEGIEPATVSGVADLPATSVVAFGMGGGADMVDSMWDSLRKQYGEAELTSIAASAEQELGVRLPEDLRTLLGKNLLLALDGEGLDEGNPSFGAQVTTDVAAAKPVLDKLRPMLQSGLPEAVVEMTDDGYLVASDSAAADWLSGGGGGTLADDEVFAQALPDVEGARFAVWLDLGDLLRGLGAEDENAEPLAGAGVTASYEGSNGDFRFRLVTK